MQPSLSVAAIPLRPLTDGFAIDAQLLGDLSLLFALAHVNSFWSEPFWALLGQQLYAFALGILYAYWREKSGSLLAPIVTHNLSDGVEYALMLLMTWLWR